MPVTVRFDAFPIRHQCLFFGTRSLEACIVHSEEQLICNQLVRGSNP